MIDINSIGSVCIAVSQMNSEFFNRGVIAEAKVAEDKIVIQRGFICYNFHLNDNEQLTRALRLFNRLAENDLQIKIIYAIIKPYLTQGESHV